MGSIRFCKIFVETDGHKMQYSDLICGEKCCWFQLQSKVILALLFKEQSSLCDTLSYVRKRFLVPFISSVTRYHRDQLMVLCSWSNGLVVHVQFWSSQDPMGPHKGT